MLKVTHGSRVIDPASGLTKLDLVRYYAQVAPWVLPHLKGRPAYIRRAPQGIAEAMVFQQHPEGLRGLRGTDPALWPGHAPALAFDTPQDVVAAAQIGMIELHTWNSTAAAIDRPDRMVLDLDPGEDLPWPQVCEGALLLKALLQELGLRSWLKTSGGKGLHLWVPLAPEHPYAVVKDFSEAIVRHMADTIPQRFVAKSGPRNRVGRIFIDYLRNGWVQSTAEAFSARARPGLGVSMPVRWDELSALAGGDHWDIVTGPAHLARLRDAQARLHTVASKARSPGCSSSSMISSWVAPCRSTVSRVSASAVNWPSSHRKCRLRPRSRSASSSVKKPSALWPLPSRR